MRIEYQLTAPNSLNSSLQGCYILAKIIDKIHVGGNKQSIEIADVNEYDAIQIYCYSSGNGYGISRIALMNNGQFTDGVSIPVTQISNNTTYMATISLSNNVLSISNYSGDISIITLANIYLYKKIK